MDAGDDPDDLIKVAGGDYTGVHARGGVTQTIYLSKSLTIRGGYAMGSWATFDPDANPTTLDAQGQGRVLYVTGASITLQSTLWYGNGATTDGPGAGSISSSGDLTGDPAFVDPAAWDYHIRGVSAAMGAGVDAGETTDLDGEPRPIGPAPDIGADEYVRWVYLPIVWRNY